MTESATGPLAADGTAPDGPATTFSAAGVLAGMRGSVAASLGIVGYGVIFGALARNVGFSIGESLLMSGFVYTGAGQFAALNLWASPPPYLTIWLTTALVSLRLLVLGATLRPWLAPLRPIQAYGTLATLIDQSWAVSMIEYRAGRRDAGFLLGNGIVILAAWLVGTAAGFLLGDLAANAAAFGLDFAVTAIFVALIAGLWSGRHDAVPWIAAAVVSIATYKLVAGPWYVITGAVAGVLAGQLAERLRGQSEQDDQDGKSEQDAHA
jgi:4-azaleucine resistance transporter AzlC